MSSFEVSPSELESLAASLGGLLSELEGASSNIRAGAGAGAQNGELEGAIDHFLGDWSGALESMKSNVREVSTRLAAAGQAYAAIDQNIASHFGSG